MSQNTGASFRSGERAAMRPNSTWKEMKDFLLSLSVEDRRQHYKVPRYIPLRNIPVFTPTPDGSGRPLYPRNEKLDQKISLFIGDITKLEIDAIVNAANEHLLGGSGVDGAIHEAAGPKLKKECITLDGCETGQSKITGGYGLPAKYVIHTVGPIVWGGVKAKDRDDLRECYRSTLELAVRNNIRTLAVPCISTGIYSYPGEKAAREALATVREYLDEHHDKFDRVIFCVFLQKDKEIYLRNLPLFFPGAPSTGPTDKELTEEKTSADKEQTEHKTSADKEQTEQKTSADKELTSTDKEEKMKEHASKGPIDDKEKTEENASKGPIDDKEKTEENASKGPIDDKEQTEHEGM